MLSTLSSREPKGNERSCSTPCSVHGRKNTSPRSKHPSYSRNRVTLSLTLFFTCTARPRFLSILASISPPLFASILITETLYCRYIDSTYRPKASSSFSRPASPCITATYFFSHTCQVRVTPISSLSVFSEKAGSIPITYLAPAGTDCVNWTFSLLMIVCHPVKGIPR